MHAWYSDMQTEYVRTIFWKRSNGEIVECTCVAKNKEDAPSWPDVEYLGEVSEYYKPGNFRGKLIYYADN